MAATTTRNAIIQAVVEGILTDLMVKTNVQNVFVDETTTLAAKLAEIVAAINERAKSADVTAEIKAAIADLIGGAPETFDTLKEISDYIAEHQDVVDAINAAIGNKADKSALDALQEAIDASSHNHDNKAVLDGITAETVSGWNGKSKVTVGTSQPANMAAGDLFFKLVD
jgi:hypothetical protein